MFLALSFNQLTFLTGLFSHQSSFFNCFFQMKCCIIDVLCACAGAMCTYAIESKALSLLRHSRLYSSTYRLPALSLLQSLPLFPDYSNQFVCVNRPYRLPALSLLQSLPLLPDYSNQFLCVNRPAAEFDRNGK